LPGTAGGHRPVPQRLSHQGRRGADHLPGGVPGHQGRGGAGHRLPGGGEHGPGGQRREGRRRGVHHHGGGVRRRSMRNIRRTLALILALVMALSVSAFAADSGAGDDTGMGDCCEAGTCTMPCCADDGEETEAPPACTCGGTGLEAASVAAEVEPDASGTIGQSALTWTLRNGILTIGGTGSVAPFASRDDQPWAEVREEISQVWFDDMEAVSIPDLAYWFTDCVNL